ncbi:putative 2-dehydropantoate 2-reductase [Sporosarcina sp. NCCP-2716]|uniref:ketopantoate reductase family protein n=1 Tax=Sporosarcina sp. NCCP-2716 TaxID=2943679 RepID=UPI00203A5CDA|nr:2-dehydropantoate 2-reductase [Sporosarcina sp. NCCP-2716]GKV67706.1 putative 2-dehydropantoate 2-reductase [Sporosarcina sp. NCCP-2716]
MDIVIGGAGAIGLLIGSCLAEAGHSVSFWTRRPEQAQALRENGLVRIEGGYTERFAVGAFTSVCEAPAGAMWIAAVKSSGLPALISRLGTAEPPGYVLFIQNGIRHFEEADRLDLPSFGFASVTFGARRENDWTVRCLGRGHIEAAHWQGDAGLLDTLLHSASPVFPIVRQADAESMLYRKVFVNCCVNPLTALLGVKNGELLKRPAARGMMEAVYGELAAAYPDIAGQIAFSDVEAVCSNTAGNESSMLTDRRKGVPMETDTIVTAVIGRRRDEMPMLGLLESLLKAIDEREESL